MAQDDLSEKEGREMDVRIGHDVGGLVCDMSDHLECEPSKSER